MRMFSRLLIGLSVVCLSGVGLTACGGKNKSGPLQVQSDLADIEPYLATSAYQTVMKRCASADADGESCTLRELPPLAMEHPNPTIADVMSRVLVSHAWMGERFAQILEEMPDDMYQLFGAVTSVVIDDDTRPSYYDPFTGSIYLDPDNLWLTNAEFADISTKEDYRGEYIRQMAYRPAWRYTNGTAADETRTLESISLEMAQLLFHELAHANDLLPPTSYATVDIDKSVNQVTYELHLDSPSARLIALYPLNSSAMFHLSSILYLGVSPSTADRATTAAEVGAHFAPDRANDDYAYATRYEDLAMLFEEAMMKLHFDMDRDVGFLIAPAQPMGCNSLILGWGERNRLGHARLSERAQWVTEQMLPARDYSMLFDNFPAPVSLPAGAGWCASEGLLSANFEKSFAAPQTDQPINPKHIYRQQRVQYGF